MRIGHCSTALTTLTLLGACSTPTMATTATAPQTASPTGHRNRLRRQSTWPATHRAGDRRVLT